MLEVNIDCLSGPTHHFGGLAFGNVASTLSQAMLSHPKKAALQGLEKMKLLYDLGVPQIIFPPHPRPDFSALKALGFEGTHQAILEKAYKLAPNLLLICSSSSAMWMANAAIITSSHDSADHRVHITPANLASNLHRSLEVKLAQALLQKTFHHARYFTHHAPLLSALELFDEGAANYTRFCSNDEKNGLHFFVYGRQINSKKLPKKYPARQTKEAQIAICRLHELREDQLIFAQQNPLAIDAGVFHNDVISTGFETIFIYHEDAFVDTEKVIDKLQESTARVLKCPLTLVKIKRRDLSLQNAVKSYLFNSQIVRSENKIVLIAPMECKKIPAAKASLETIECIDKVIYLSLDESMKNGGGPACLRLRVPLTEAELKTVYPHVIFTDALYKKLKNAILKYYPDSLCITDFLDRAFLKEAERANKEIYRLLHLEELYEQFSS